MELIRYNRSIANDNRGNSEFEPISDSEIKRERVRKAINQLNSVANKRLARIERQHLEVGIARISIRISIQRRTIRISEPGVTKRVLRIDLGDVKRFLEK